MLVISTHFHDVGMALSGKEREERLTPGSDLWDNLANPEETKSGLDRLRHQGADCNLSEAARRMAKQQLDQAEEALLCADTRLRHATQKRYDEILKTLAEFQRLEPIRLPAIESCLSFDGDSFGRQIVDICVSHNEASEALVRRDPKNPERPRFPVDFPIGCCTADLQLVAATLRLADILDFDRERTPAILFHYLLPSSLTTQNSRSVLEWSKHMAISHWAIEGDRLVFRGRCSDHIVHHAIVHFGAAIQQEIEVTRATFGKDDGSWPFQLTNKVEVEIHEQGYTYVPYRFQLDDQCVYELLMGGAIYPNPLFAVRELVQNAVDACKLRDALTSLNESYVKLGLTNRILVRYEEAQDGSGIPSLTVEDTGTGMDRYIIENYFLKIGQSYYRSAEFIRERAQLRRRELDFAPVSEFGIGFLSCFLLADRVEVETAMWEPLRGDNHKRKLIIDGPTRLIRMDEQANEGSSRFKGTSVTLRLIRGSSTESGVHAPTWEEVKSFITSVCRDLPYCINLEYVAENDATVGQIVPKPMTIRLPHQFEPVATRIVVNDKELEGEIVLVHPYDAERIEKDQITSIRITEEPQDTRSEADYDSGSELVRGGFRIGSVPGLPRSIVSTWISRAKLRLLWKERRDRRYVGCNLGRTEASDQLFVAEQVTRIWLSHLLDHVEELRDGQLFLLSGGSEFSRAEWLQKYSALDLYNLARKGWHVRSRLSARDEDPVQAWEDGRTQRISLGIFRDDIYWRLLDLVLPRVTHLQMGPQGTFYVAKPVANWKTILQGCHDYISAPVSWGPFVEYVDGIQDLLAYEYPGAVQFNLRYRDRLGAFKVEELSSLLRALHTIADARGHGKQPQLTKRQALLVARAIEHCGDLEIGELSGHWPLSSFGL